MSGYKFETRQLHAGQEQADPATGARAVPIYATAAYVFDDCAHAAARFDLSEGGNIYSRLTNPTQEVLEKRAASLEGGAAALAPGIGRGSHHLYDSGTGAKWRAYRRPEDHLRRQLQSACPYPARVWHHRNVCQHP